jgi:hypothetical protein
MYLENGFNYQVTTQPGFVSQLFIDASIRFDWPLNQLCLKVNDKCLHEKTDIYEVYNEIVNVE